MESYEYRAGDTTYGPLQLKRIWEDHELRNFELLVILQVSGCEHAAVRVLRGESLSERDQLSLEIANDVARQKGHLPLFELTGGGATVSNVSPEVLGEFLRSSEWANRDRSKTRHP